jgi:hypothetical protein
MEAMHDNISGTLKTREDLTEVDVIKSSSSGLALQGILISADPTEAAEVRKNLLRVPADVCLDGPSDHQHDKIQQFFSQKKEADFSKRLKMLGYSASASAKAGFYGFSFEASAGYSRSQEEEETTEHHQEETYCSVVKYSVMPMASCTFKDHQLQLSENALVQLQKINQQLVKDLTQPIQSELRNFSEILVPMLVLDRFTLEEGTHGKATPQVSKNLKKALCGSCKVKQSQSKSACHTVA